MEFPILRLFVWKGLEEVRYEIQDANRDMDDGN